MLTLNGTKVLTERFPNNETKVKDFAKAIVEENNILEFKGLASRSSERNWFFSK